jgi:UDP-GlcNAc3NAcA epimerase
MTQSITTIAGTRPQLVKAAVVSIALREAGIDERFVDTGQHFDAEMSAVFYDELGIDRPAVDLGVHETSHAVMTARMLEGVERDLLEHRPEWVIVFGDTNSTLAGALAAAKLGIPVAHVEAGLRSFNRSMPEEVNRVAVDHLSSLLFVPTAGAAENLQKEGRLDHAIVLTGDVMYDAVRHFGAAADERSDVLGRLDLDEGAYVLATVHRAENVDDDARLRAIVDGLDGAGDELPVVWPVHPRTAGALRRAGLTPGKVRLVSPVGYLDMLRLERGARVVVTDSGGVQKEAFFARVPCVTLRDETEWTELVSLGWNRLVPPRSAADVTKGVVGALDALPGEEAEPYGDGHAAEAIASMLREA